MKKEPLRSADLLTGIIFSVLGVYVCFKSIGMFYVENIRMQEGAAWYNSPGLFPLVIGAGFTLLSVLLILNSIKEKGSLGILRWSRIKGLFKDNRFIRGVLVVLILGFYVFFLLDRFPFFMSTFIFLITCMSVFKAEKWYKIIIYSFVFAWMITYIFGTVVKIPMPGGMLRVFFLPGV